MDHFYLKNQCSLLVESNATYNIHAKSQIYCLIWSSIEVVRRITYNRRYQSFTCLHFIIWYVWPIRPTTRSCYLHFILSWNNWRRCYEQKIAEEWSFQCSSDHTLSKSLRGKKSWYNIIIHCADTRGSVGENCSNRLDPPDLFTELNGKFLFWYGSRYSCVITIISGRPKYTTVLLLLNVVKHYIVAWHFLVQIEFLNALFVNLLFETFVEGVRWDSEWASIILSLCVPRFSTTEFFILYPSQLDSTVIVSASLSADDTEGLFERETFYLKLNFAESARLFSPSISSITIHWLAALRLFSSVITTSAPHEQIRAVNSFSAGTLKYPPSCNHLLHERVYSVIFSLYSSSSFAPHLDRFSFITLPTDNNNNNYFL